nr:putative integron gene cassette protein [uncultured bacterium]
MRTLWWHVAVVFLLGLGIITRLTARRRNDPIAGVALKNALFAFVFFVAVAVVPSLRTAFWSDPADYYATWRMFFDTWWPLWILMFTPFAMTVAAVVNLGNCHPRHRLITSLVGWSTVPVCIQAFYSLKLGFFGIFFLQALGCLPVFAVSALLRHSTRNAQREFDSKVDKPHA